MNEFKLNMNEHNGMIGTLKKLLAEMLDLNF